MVLIIERKAGERINLVFIPEKEFLRFYEEHIKRESPTPLTVLVEFNPLSKQWDNKPSLERTKEVVEVTIREQSIRTMPGKITRDLKIDLHRKWRDFLKVKTFDPFRGLLPETRNARLVLTIERDARKHFLLSMKEQAEVQETIRQKRNKEEREPLVYLITHIGLSGH